MRGISKRTALAVALNTPHVIYALLDPCDMLPRYIGRTKNLGARTSAHRGNAHNNPPKDAWAAELRLAGLRPVVKTLATVVGIVPAIEAEDFWTQHGRENGWPLFNGSGARAHVGNIGIGALPGGLGRWTLARLGLAPHRGGWLVQR